MTDERKLNAIIFERQRIAALQGRQISWDEANQEVMAGRRKLAEHLATAGRWLDQAEALRLEKISRERTSM